MKYFIIIFVIALALAPLAHFVPSKRQRRVARLREYAATHGLFVEFRNLPGPDNPYAPTGSGNIIYYGKRIRARGRQRVRCGQWLFRDAEWRALERRAPVPDPLADLPENMLAAGVDQDSCGIYWEEQGEEAQIDQICEVLERLSDWALA